MVKCEICGKEHEGKKYSNWSTICSSDCFTQKFWLEIAKEAEAKKYLHPVIDGHCYCIQPEDEKGPRGYSGAQFYITFDDGHMVATTNLWDNGQVDSRFRDRLPNNAHRSTTEEIAKNPEIRAYYAGKLMIRLRDFGNEYRYPTMKNIARDLRVSVTTIRKDLYERLPKINEKLALQVKGVLETTKRDGRSK